VQPVVPKIRVGDVLRGTRNLRSWIHASMWKTYIDASDRGVLYLPTPRSIVFNLSKEDDFIVAVNAWNKFAVWHRKQKLLILFLNGQSNSDGISERPRQVVEIPERHRKLRKMNSIHPIPSDLSTTIPFGLRSKRFEERYSRRHTYMSPELFARWFIRTPERHPDLRRWPLYAHHTWAALHMNASHPLLGDYQLHFPFCPNPSHSAFSVPRAIEGLRGGDRGQLFQYALMASKTGVVRFRNSMGGVLPVGPQGPRLEDISRIKEDAKSIIRKSNNRKKGKSSNKPSTNIEDSEANDKITKIFENILATNY
jgi:hypothetical protein